MKLEHFLSARAPSTYHLQTLLPWNTDFTPHLYHGDLNASDHVSFHSFHKQWAWDNNTMS